MTKDWYERLEAVDAALKETMIQLRETQRRMIRSRALFKLSEKDNPYYPLVRVMCKLKLIRDWPI